MFKIVQYHTQLKYNLENRLPEYTKRGKRNVNEFIEKRIFLLIIIGRIAHGLIASAVRFSHTVHRARARARDGYLMIGTTKNELFEYCAIQHRLVTVFDAFNMFTALPNGNGHRN